jgi:uncharacterized phiE125 gp8 family phage protein
MGYKLKTAPAVEPVTLEEAKLHLRVDSDCTGEDVLITSLITAARQMVENYTGLALINQTWEMLVDEFPDDDMALRPAPLSSITSITYTDINGATQTASPTTVYTADTYSLPGAAVLRYGQTWPTVRDIKNAITVTYVAGFGTAASSVPGPIKAAILLLIGHLFEHRESVVIGTISSELPQGVEYLLNPYRLIEM